MGLEAKGYIERGSYVPDEIILKMVSEWLGGHSTGWLMDGFPRTIPQAKALQEIAKPTRVIALDVPQDELEFRITKRRECTTCGATVLSHVATGDNLDLLNEFVDDRGANRSVAQTRGVHTVDDVLVLQ